jgi:CRISPR-associated protein Csm1
MIGDSALSGLAGMIHDIGKLCQRAFWSERRGHEDHGREWVEGRLLPRLAFLGMEQRGQIAQIVGDHHRPHPYERDLRVAQMADWLASGERVERAAESGPGAPSTEPLRPVFAHIALDGRSLPDEDRSSWAYSGAPLRMDASIFPSLTPGRCDYQALWGGFDDAWARIPDQSPSLTDPDAFALTWMSLTRIFAWCVPAAAYRHEADISLADHLQMTGALAACLWELPDPILDRLESDPFQPDPIALLVGGDVSGIQSFLYSITSAGAAKSLRGRSAYLTLLCDAAAEHVRRSLGLLPCNLLYSSGGHFYLLAPLGVEDRLQELRRGLMDVLLDFFGGDIGIVLDAVPLKGSDLRVAPEAPQSPLGALWGQLGERLRAAKRTPLRDLAIQNPARVFGPFGVGGRETFCAVCHAEPDQPEPLRARGLTRPIQAPEGEDAKCSLCASFEELSRRIGRATYMVMRHVSPRTGGPLGWHSALAALGIELWLADEEQVSQIAQEGDWVFRLNVPLVHPVRSADKTVPVVGFRFMPAFTPRDPDGSVRELADLAVASRGATYFGSLRMDVDSLGRLFSEGLAGRLSLSRLATLSRALSAFFEGYLNTICQQLDPEARRLYLLYAGGDDLLAVGSWDAVLTLAQEIRDQFRAYTCGNPALTVSGGTALHHQKFPLYQAAEVSGGFLEAAKAWRREGREKNALGMWGATVEWDDLAWARSWHDRIAQWLEAGDRVSRSFLFKLGRIASLHDACKRRLRRQAAMTEHDIRRRIRAERWLWTLVYYLAKERGELQADLSRLRAELIEHNRIEQLGLLTRWVELSTRDDRRR